MCIKIVVPISCRSDEGLSKPIIKRLKNNTNFDVCVWICPEHVRGDVFMCTIAADLQFKTKQKPDLVLIVGDRVEMTGISMAAFHNNIPIAHVYAGSISGDNTFDQYNRHVITLWSDIQFCESESAADRVYHLKRSAGLVSNRFIVGCTHLDDLEIYESVVPQYSYDLLLYNPITKSCCPHKKIIDDLYKILSVLDKSTPIIWIYPNPDKNADITISSLTMMLTDSEYDFTHHENLMRPQFLGLLKNCNRFITNSSSQFYEAPYFLKKDKIINIGKRNDGRETITAYGASDKIVAILENEFIRHKHEH